ncbi:MAG: hypothetical protein K2M91_08345, partial [Lachnospiraceae bacterium]|nr:hypothetical protein [Lachnospiraceae bacterium]
IYSILKTKSKGIPTLFIAVGCLLILLYGVFVFFQKTGFIQILIIGMLFISIGTFLNGVLQGNVHIHHHIVRLIVETVITLICWVGI